MCVCVCALLPAFTFSSPSLPLSLFFNCLPSLVAMQIIYANNFTHNNNNSNEEKRKLCYTRQQSH